MPKYKVVGEIIRTGTLIVEASSPEDAVQQYMDASIEELDEGPPFIDEPSAEEAEMEDE